MLNSLHQLSLFPAFSDVESNFKPGPRSVVEVVLQRLDPYSYSMAVQI